MTLSAIIIYATFACTGGIVFFNDVKMVKSAVSSTQVLKIGDMEIDNPLPKYLLNTEYHVPESPGLLPGGFFKFMCPSDCGICSFYFTVHDCPPCSDKYDGGIPVIAAVDREWEYRTCGPHFSDNPMSVYRTVVQPGREKELSLIKQIKFFGIFSAVSHSMEWCEPPQRDFGPQQAKQCLALDCPYP